MLIPFLGVCALWLGGFAALRTKSLVCNAWSATLVGVTYSITVAAWFAGRPFSLTSDMANYLLNGDIYEAQSLPQLIEGSHGRDIAFGIYQWLLVHVSSGTVIFPFVSALLILAISLLASITLFGAVDGVLTFVPISLSPVFFSYATNTIRQGVAASLIIYSLALVAKNRNTKIFLLPACAAVLVHLSAAVPLLIIVLLRFFGGGIRAAVIVWLCAAATYISGINEAVFGAFASENTRLQGYTTTETLASYGAGNRLDFLLVGLGLVGSVVAYRTVRGPLKRETDVLATALVLLNVYFVVFGFIAYADRLAAYSWLLAPYVAARFLLPGDLDRSSGRIALVALALVGWLLLGDTSQAVLMKTGLV